MAVEEATGRSVRGLDTAERDLVAKAMALVPELEARAPEAERLGRMPDETIANLRDAGLLRLTLPRARRGHQVSVEGFVAVQEALAHGCASTSWVSSIYNGNIYLAHSFSDEAQEELLADEQPLIVGNFNPSGQAVPVDGGFQLSGTWRFCSGQHHADWAFLTSFVVIDGEAPVPGQFVVPRADWTARDDWQVAGLAGTGSNTLDVKAFVPEHRALLASDLEAGFTPRSMAEDPYYRMAHVPYFTAASCGTPLGLAARAVELFAERVQKRGITYTQYARQADAAVTHMQIDEATMKRDQARFHAARAAATAGGLLRESEDVLARVRCRSDVGWATALSREAVEIVQNGSGGSAIHLKDPLQRIVRDVQAISLHSFLLFSTSAELHGRVLCGLAPGVPFI